METKYVSLRVQEAFHQDLGLGRARIDTKTREIMDLEIGDVIEIKGKRSTAARVFRTQLEDEDKGIIRIDSITRGNANVSVEERVTIDKVKYQPAEKVILAPILSNDHKIKFGEGLSNFVLRVLQKHPIVEGDSLVVPGITLMGGYLPFVVIKTKPSGIVQIVENTAIEIREEPYKEVGVTNVERTSYEDVGGLKEEIRRIREMVELPLRHPELFEKLGIKAPKGVLLYGSPGTGKTLIAKAVAYESSAFFRSIQGPEIMSQYYGQSEAKLRDIFDEAEKHAPAIIFIDEIDSIAPKRDDAHGEVERRVVAQLLTLMDGLTSRSNIIVIGATNREDSIDPALRRPGRFDREIEITIPNRVDRIEIMHVHARFMPIGSSTENRLLDDKEREALMEKLSNLTHGYVGADLSALCREAAMRALRRYLPEIDLRENIPRALMDSMYVIEEDFLSALKDMEPSSLRDVAIDIPHVKWDDIGGLDEVKKTLIEVIEIPLKKPELFGSIGIAPPRGVLLYGPPGTGKTLIAKAIATESGTNFISIKGPEVLSKWLGESEKAIRQLFKKAKQAAPSIIFIDEIDSIASKRRSDDYTEGTVDRIVNQLLTTMDGIDTLDNVIILAATNRPDMIDESLLRAGRFDRLIYIAPPDKKARSEILKIHTRNIPLDSDVDIDRLVSMTENFVGADIMGFCREAVMNAIRDSGDLTKVKVSMKYFEKALSVIHPTMNDKMKEFYEQFSKSTYVPRLKKESLQYYG
ncbi:MAG: CDC48 family AAA ATPase [Candidatus Thermoplasmatota archaeon]|jgi:transitional endoplasmic reticulum ATPase|nr:CDC48 family AAA ATPase [Candidatus Thermoplasmatota archaeon]MCL5963967.1 CDC48 family AAA ATPase [Candidatus Thermoplasmatota archaeon]